MAKKSFRGENPALRYISVPGEEYTDIVQDTQKTQQAQNEHTANDTHNKRNVYNEDTAQNQRISLVRETKSKRLNLLIRPSLYKDAAKIAHMQRVSINELIHLAIEIYVGEREQELRKYKDVYGE